MAYNDITPVKLGQAAIGTGVTTLYTVPASTRSFVKNLDIVKNAIIKVNGFETHIDNIFRDAITQLFENPPDVLEVIKWKEMYQYLEDTADSCEEIATAIEGVVAKND